VPPNERQYFARYDATGNTATVTWADVTDTTGTTTGQVWYTRAVPVTGQPHEPANADHEDYDWTTDPEASQMAEAVAAQLDEASIEKLTTEAIAGGATDKQAVIEKAQKMAAIAYKGITARRRQESLEPDFEALKRTIDKVDGLGTRLQSLMDEFHAAQERIRQEEEFGEFDELEKEFRKKFRSLYKDTERAATACQESSWSLQSTRRHLDEGMIIEVMCPSIDGDMKFRLARQMVALINNYGIDNVNVSGKDARARIAVTIPPKVLETEDKAYRLSLSSVTVFWNPNDGVRFSAKYTKAKLSTDGRQHPHVMTDGHICLGNADVELGGSVKEGRVFDVFKTIETLLSDAKEGGMYHIRNWPDCETCCAISGELITPKNATTVRINGRDVRVKKELVTMCPATGVNVVKGGDDAVEHEGVIYHRDAFLHAEGHDPLPVNDPTAVTAVLSQQKIHPANVAVCEVSGITGRKIDDKNNKFLENPDDIVTLEDGRLVAMAMLDLAMLDDTTNFGSRGNLLRGWSRDKKDQMRNTMAFLNNKYTHNNNRRRRMLGRPNWLDMVPAWRATLEENQGVMTAR